MSCRPGIPIQGWNNQHHCDKQTTLHQYIVFIYMHGLLQTVHKAMTAIESEHLLATERGPALQMKLANLKRI